MCWPNRTCLCLVAAVAGFLLVNGWPMAARCHAADPTMLAARDRAVTEDDGVVTSPPSVDFHRDVEPIIVAKCVRCHGPGMSEAGLRLDRRESAVAELDSGKRAIVPEQPDESELLRRIAADESERMPLEGEPLTANQIAVLRAWIAAGAKWPEHWAYRPLVKPPVPALHDAQRDAELAAWARTPIDRFILQSLVAHGLRPAPPADRRTLIRRLSFDLWGLPPLVEEIEAFTSDRSPDAYEQLVDRMLASSRYGERWARHWMDVVHYADSHGFEHDLPRQIWPYRDYLVRAFNEDKPYARFVREQIAGDVLFPGDPDALAATGFLATGPWDQSALQAGNGEAIDRLIGQVLDRDDIVSTVMSTFVSSTVHCARCHDHKFDPISQADYYALQAVFAGIDKAHRLYDPDAEVARRRQALTSRLAMLPRLRDAQDSSLLAAEAQAEAAAWEARLRERRTRWQVLKPVELRSASGVTFATSADGSVLSGGMRPATDTYTIVVRTMMPAIHALGLELLPDESLPGRGPGRADDGGLSLSELTVRVAPADDPSSARAVSLARPQADFNQHNAHVEQAIDKNEKTGWGIAPQFGTAHVAVFELAEGLRNTGPLELTFELKQTQGNGQLIGRMRLWATDADVPHPLEVAPLPAGVAEAMPIPPESRTDAQRLRVAAFCLEYAARTQLAELPKQQLLYCGTNQFETVGSFHPAAQPRPVHVLERGDIHSPGAPAVPGTLRCISGLEGTFALDDPDDEAARRRALADWLAAPGNVLTWRSIANRLWHFHFGCGLVDTPNDFGRMGSSPTHPELLDWLAATLRDNGGSLKAIHRMIVTSAVYRQSSGHDPRAAAIDAENKYLWRMNRRRLDAESVRDALLRLSGRLDGRMGGPPVKHFVETRKFNERPEADYALFNVDDPANQRRSVYRFHYRTFPDPLMSALDCPDGTQRAPTRTVSLTSLQALATLNDKFVVRQSEHLANRIQAAHTERPAQVTTAFRMILGRPPAEDEIGPVAAYAEQFGLANACRFLLNTNEFMFLD